MAKRPWDAMVHDQVENIKAAFAMNGTDGIHVERDNDGGVRYMCVEDEILVAEEHSDKVKEFIGTDEAEIKWVVRGVVRHGLRGSAHPTFRTALPEIEGKRGRGVETPNHTLTVAGVAGPCPATEPEQVYAGVEPFPAVQASGGAGVLIYIADTGLIESTVASTPWLGGVQRAMVPGGQQAQPWDALPLIAPDPQPGPAAGQPAAAAGQQAPAAAQADNPANGQQPPQAGQQGAGSVAEPLAAVAAEHRINPYTGHGTFVAGVARCMAPQADVVVANIFKTAGSALESDFVRDLDRALDLGVDVFNLSITAPTMHDRPLLAFGRWLQRAQQYKGVVCVAAAGNSGQRYPSWPAASPGVVSVGALAADWRSRANFSNYGGWVDVYAPGRNLVNAFAAGSYTCYVDPYKGEPRTFYGMARWSGTSFSAPMVTGLIAARMSRTGESGTQAAAALLDEARAQAIPGTGPVLRPYGNHAA
jgi:subtilase family protein